MQKNRVLSPWLTMLAGVGVFWATPSYAELVTTGQATYSLDNGWQQQGDTIQSSDGRFALYRSVDEALVRLQADDSGFVAGASTRGYNPVSGSATVDWNMVLTNTSATAQHYTYSFVINGSFLSVVMGGNVQGNGQASFGVTVSGAGMGTLYSTYASLDESGALTHTGATLAGANASPITTFEGVGFSYSWDATTVVLDLGVLAPAQTLELDYELSYAASSDFTSNGNYLADTFSLYGGAARSGLMDPGVFSGTPGTIDVVAATVTAVPEPTSLALLAAGLPLLWARRRRVMPF